MIKIDRPALPTEWLRFVPLKTLYEFDGPRIFTCVDVNGQMFLAYQCDEDTDGMQFLVVPLEEELVSRLVKGLLSVRDALRRSPMWLVEANNEWTPIRCWAVEFDELPKRALPKPDTLLWAHLQNGPSVQTEVATSTPSLTGSA